MSNPKIKFKRSSVEGKKPSLSNLELGEVALNTYDGKLFTRQDTSGVGIATTITNLTPWSENFGGNSIFYTNSVGIGTTKPEDASDPNNTSILNVGVVTANFLYGNGSNLVDVNVSSAATIATATITNTIFGSGTAITSVDTDLSSVSTTDNTLASAKAIKTYVDNQITSGDLDIAGDTGTGSVDLNSQSLTIAGTESEIVTSASGQTITVGLPDNVIVGSALTVTGALDVNDGLDVAGATTITASSTSTLFIKNNNVDTNGLKLSSDAAGVSQIDGGYGELALLTAASERMRIDSSGNVGINETDPSYKLDVDGDIRATGELRGGGSNITGIVTSIVAGNNISISGSTGQVTISSSDATNASFDTLVVSGFSTFTDGSFSGDLSVAGTLTYEDVTNVDSIGLITARSGVNITNGGLTATGDILPNTDNTGNVGTTNFTWANGQFTNLTVNGTLNVRAAIDLADNDQIRLGSNDDSRLFYDGTNNTLELELESTTNSFIITDNGTTKFTFEKDGNFGIGTSSPDAKLQINSDIVGASATYPGSLQINGGPTSLEEIGGIEFKTSSFGSGFGWKISSTDPGGGVDLRIGTRQNSATWSDVVTLDSNSNVGIGTDNPQDKLHILDSTHEIKFGNVADGPSNGTTDAGVLFKTGTSQLGGMFTELDGKILSYGTNIFQLESTGFDSARSGGIFRFDTRTGAEYTGSSILAKHCFVIKGREEGQTSEYSAFGIDLNTGDTLLCPEQGNVGVGTATPGYKLDVNGDIKVGELGTLWFSDASGSIEKIVGSLGELNLYADAEIRFYESDTNGESFSIDVNNSRAFFQNDSDTYWYHPAANTHAWTTNNVERFRIGSDGTAYFADDVGIGNNNPGAKLDVFGTARIGGTASSNRRADFDTNGRLTLAYGDNNNVSNLILANLATDATTNHGSNIAWDFGTNTSASPITAATIDVVKEQQWTSTATTRDAKFAIKLAENGVLGEKFSINSNGNVTLTGDLDLDDNKKIVLGTGNDCEIYHDGNNNVIEAINGNLVLEVPEGNQIALVKSGGEFEGGLRFIAGGAVEISFDNVVQFKTTSTGVDVTGICTAFVLHGEGGTFNAGNDTATDAGFILEEENTIYTKDGTFLRNLIQKKSDIIIIGQQNTSLIDNIELKPGGAGGKVKLHAGGTSDNVKLSTTSTGVDVTGNITLTGDLDLDDNKKILLGTGNDCEIYHDGSANIIQSTNGSISLQVPEGSEIQLAQGGSFEHGVKFIAGGAVQLYNNNSLKLATTSTGVDVTGLLSATTKSFVIDHPTKEGMKLRYGSLEGPENGVYVRGRLKGNNTIELPDYWTGLVDEETITVNLTPIGRKAPLHSVVDIADNTVVVESANDIVDCFYTVFGERKDVERFEVEF